MGTNLILITGSPGVGKTTVLINLAETIMKKSIKIEGFLTEEVRSENHKRIGFDVHNLNNGQISILARISDFASNYPLIGKYSVYIDSFDKQIVEIFENSASTNLFLIDEIGKMELLSKKFTNQIKKLIEDLKERKVNVIATIPLKSRIRIVDELQSIPRCKIFVITHKNRNKLFSEIQNFCLKEMLNT